MVHTYRRDKAFVHHSDDRHRNGRRTFANFHPAPAAPLPPSLRVTSRDQPADDDVASTSFLRNLRSSRMHLATSVLGPPKSIASAPPAYTLSGPVIGVIRPHFFCTPFARVVDAPPPPYTLQPSACCYVESFFT
uniref:Uncharacterized protein n=1 Tax=Schizaphis graminum TaxID=13262 RepID=A0A2S2N9Z3_SCHGA